MFFGVLYLLINQIDKMINYQDPYISLIDTDSDFNKIGKWTLDEMGLNPFLFFSYRGEELPTYSEDICGETAGDCVKWINSYLKITWSNGNWFSNNTF
mgnify:CR=1 FL=1